LAKVAKNSIITLDSRLLIFYHITMIISPRQGRILEKVVEEHINSARPVSSKLIEEKYDFSVCPATIRNDMQRLTDWGFLFQPHTSAGRVPTDKGYRFFVDHLLEGEILGSKDALKISEILQQEEDIFKFAARLSRFLAETSSNLATIHLFDRDFFWKEGWEEVLREPEFGEKDFIVSFTKLLKKFEQEIKNMEMSSEIRIYIGQENPFLKTKDFSIISTRCSFPKKVSGIVSLLGPKRMTYGKNIRLINSLSKVLGEF